MQDDLNASLPWLDIEILGVNPRGAEAGNPLIASERDIPWLQDVDSDLDGFSDAWTSWGVQYRDVVILDGDNAVADVFNLTVHDLQVPMNYVTLARKFVDVASIPEPAGIGLMVVGALALLRRPA